MGSLVGTDEGFGEGTKVEGTKVGSGLGYAEGSTVGNDEGEAVGAVGIAVGSGVGTSVFIVGLALGNAVGIGHCEGSDASLTSPDPPDRHFG